MCVKDAIWANRSCEQKWELLTWLSPIAMYASMYYKPLDATYAAALVVHGVLIICAAMCASRSHTLVVAEWICHTIAAMSVALAWHLHDIGGDDTWVYPSMLGLLQILTIIVATETWMRGCSIIDTLLKYIKESSFYIMVTLICIFVIVLTDTAEVAHIVIVVFSSIYAIEWWVVGSVLILNGPFTICGFSTALTQRQSNLNTAADLLIVYVYISGSMTLVTGILLKLTGVSLAMSATVCAFYITSQFYWPPVRQDAYRLSVTNVAPADL